MGIGRRWQKRRKCKSTAKILQWSDGQFKPSTENFWHTEDNAWHVVDIHSKWKHFFRESRDISVLDLGFLFQEWRVVESDIRLNYGFDYIGNRFAAFSSLLLCFWRPIIVWNNSNGVRFKRMGTAQIAEQGIFGPDHHHIISSDLRPNKSSST